jgi:hypothetical protein
VRWFHHFFGTPRRLTTTLICLALVVVVVSPGLLALAVARLVQAVSPLLGPALTILIVLAGLRTILHGRK